MKKFLICVSLVGITAQVAYWLYKKEKTSNSVTATTCKNSNSEFKTRKETVSQKVNSVEEMYQAKEENRQNVYERHTEAGEILKDAYSNIMEEFVDDFSDENTHKEETKAVPIDNEDVSVLKELDSISDELNDLLK